MTGWPWYDRGSLCGAVIGGLRRRPRPAPHAHVRGHQPASSVALLIGLQACLQTLASTVAKRRLLQLSSGGGGDGLDELADPALVDLVGQVSLADDADEVVTVDDRKATDLVLDHGLQRLVD